MFLYPSHSTGNNLITGDLGMSMSKTRGCRNYCVREHDKSQLAKRKPGRWWWGGGGGYGGQGDMNWCHGRDKVSYI